MANEITLYEKIADPIDAAIRLGKMFSASGMFGCQKEEQGQVLALACMCKRKDPFEIMATYHLVGNKLAMRADNMLAEFRVRGGRVDWIETTDRIAKGKWTYQEEPTLEVSFTIEEAERAGLVKKDGGWQKWPGEMLRARCTSRALRMVAPEVIVGVYLPEDLAAEAPITVSAPPLFPEFTKPIEAEIVKEAAPATNMPATPVESAPEPKGSVPVDYMDLERLIKDEEAVCNAWLLKQNWIKEGQTFRDLLPRQIKRILERPEAWFRAVKGVAQ